jgi:hypothetical protein
MKFTNKEAKIIFLALDNKTYMNEDAGYDKEEYKMVMNLFNRFKQKDNPRLTLEQKEYLLDLMHTYKEFNMKEGYADDEERANADSIINQLNENIEWLKSL